MFTKAGQSNLDYNIDSENVRNSKQKILEDMIKYMKMFLAVWQLGRSKCWFKGLEITAMPITNNKKIIICIPHKASSHVLERVSPSQILPNQDWMHALADLSQV